MVGYAMVSKHVFTHVAKHVYLCFARPSLCDVWEFLVWFMTPPCFRSEPLFVWSEPTTGCVFDPKLCHVRVGL